MFIIHIVYLIHFINSLHVNVLLSDIILCYNIKFIQLYMYFYDMLNNY